MMPIAKSELIINPDGSIFHLHLKPEQISDTIILVGDQDRVEMITKHFDTIEYKTQNREFRSHSGYYQNTFLTVLSTGIGTDNIDIVVNELDALVNIDLKTRTIKQEKKSLNFIRIGTSGALQKDIPVDSFVVSKMAIGFDGLLNFYANRDKISHKNIEQAFLNHTNWNETLPTPYFVEASEALYKKLGHDMKQGITISAPGFYGPQGRVLRIPTKDKNLNNKISNFSYNQQKITNFEMESSAIYGLSKHLGHQALTVCDIIANRSRGEYSKDYKKSMEKLILLVLDRLGRLGN